MEELPLSYTAIIVATLANFFIGFLWYSVIVQKIWMKEMNIPTDVKPAGGMMVKSLLMNIVGCFLIAFVFAHNNAAWSFVPGIETLGKAGSIANAAIFTWLGFFVPVDLNTVAFEGRSWKLFFINTTYHLLLMIVSSIILHTL